MKCFKRTSRILGNLALPLLALQHPDLRRRADDADGSHELSAHAVVLVAEHMLDPRPNL